MCIIHGAASSRTLLIRAPLTLVVKDPWCRLESPDKVESTLNFDQLLPCVLLLLAITLHLQTGTLSIVQNLDLTEDHLKEPQNLITTMCPYIDGHVNESTKQRNF